MTQNEPVHWTVLESHRRSAAHARERMLRPAEPTPAMVRGQAVHALVLGGPPVEPRPLFGRTKDALAARAAWEEEHAGAIVVPEGEMDALRAMARAARDLLPVADGVAERTILWRDAATGAECEGTPDLYAPTVVYDLKTVRDAGRGMPAAVARYAWHAQLAWYADGLAAAGLASVSHYVLVAVETSPPYAAVAYTLDMEAVAAGRRLYRRLLEQHVACVASGQWPAYPPRQTLSLPPWALAEAGPHYLVAEEVTDDEWQST